jgi:quercetin dioxygenase-like cupin family protein
VICLTPSDLEFSEARIDGDASARWRSAPGHSPSTGSRASGSSIIEVPAGCRLPRHTDSAEETIVILAGSAEVEVGGERAAVSAGGVAVVPQDMPRACGPAGWQP